jgi:hypothetical protein
MAFLAPVFAFVGEEVAAAITPIVEEVAVEAYDAASGLAARIFGNGYQVLDESEEVAEFLADQTESEAEIVVSAANTSGGYLSAETDALLESHMAEFHPDADANLVALVEHGSGAETPTISENLARLANDPEYRASLLKKALYAAIAAGATISTEQLATHAYAYAINNAPKDEILTHHEFTTGALPNNPHVEPPMRYSGSDFMVSKKRSSSSTSKRKTKKYRFSQADINAAVANYKPKSSKIAVVHNRNFVDINFVNATMPTTAPAMVLPLLHSWNLAQATAGITGGIGTAGGTGVISTRTGDVITVKKITLTIGVTFLNTRLVLPNQKFNIYIFYDNDYDRVWPTASSTDLTPTPIFESGGLRTDAFRTRNGSTRYSLLKKTTLDFTNFAGVFLSGTWQPPEVNKSVSLTLNTNKQIVYESGEATGAYTKIRHGQLYLVICGGVQNNGTPAPLLSVRGAVEYDP